MLRRSLLLLITAILRSVANLGPGYKIYSYSSTCHSPLAHTPTATIMPSIGARDPHEAFISQI